MAGTPDGNEIQQARSKRMGFDSHSRTKELKGLGV